MLIEITAIIDTHYIYLSMLLEWEKDTPITVITNVMFVTTVKMYLNYWLLNAVLINN